MNLSQLLFDFVFALACGTLFAMGFIKQNQVGRRFYLYHGLGAVFLVMGAALWIPHGRQPALFLFLGFATLFSLLAGKAKLAAWVAYAFMGMTSVAALWTFPTLTLNLNALLSSLLLGFTLTAMLLGHWYLVQPKLPIEELIRVAACLISIIVLRFLFGSYQLITLISGKPEAEIYHYLLGGVPGIFILMRWCWGLLGPLVLSYLIWGTVKIRSTQSATGILYVAVLFVITGEIMSFYLALFYGIGL